MKNCWSGNVRIGLACLVFSFWSSVQSFAGAYRQFDVPGSTYTTILGINSAGEMVGQYLKAGGGSGFLYSNGSFTNINYPGTTSDAATGINDRGDIVGTYYTDSTHSFLYQAGQFTSIDYPGASSTQANGINDAGDIVGGYVDQAGMWHGFLRHDGVFTSFDGPGADFTLAFGINDQGIVSGYFGTDCDNNCDIIQSFVFYGGRLQVVGDLNTAILGINNRNQMVGDSNVVAGGEVTGCLLARHEIRDWNFPGMYSTDPYAINDFGFVVGKIVDHSNKTHGFIAEP